MTVTKNEEKPSLMERAGANISSWTGKAKETFGGLVGSENLKKDGAQQQLEADLKLKQRKGQNHAGDGYGPGDYDETADDGRNQYHGFGENNESYVVSEKYQDNRQDRGFSNEDQYNTGTQQGGYQNVSTTGVDDQGSQGFGGYGRNQQDDKDRGATGELGQADDDNEPLSLRRGNGRLVGGINQPGVNKGNDGSGGQADTGYNDDNQQDIYNDGYDQGHVKSTVGKLENELGGNDNDDNAGIGEIGSGTGHNDGQPWSYTGQNRDVGNEDNGQNYQEPQSSYGQEGLDSGKGGSRFQTTKEDFGLADSNQQVGAKEGSGGNTDYNIIDAKLYKGNYDRGNGEPGTIYILDTEQYAGGQGGNNKQIDSGNQPSNQVNFDEGKDDVTSEGTSEGTSEDGDDNGNNQNFAKDSGKQTDASYYQDYDDGYGRGNVEDVKNKFQSGIDREAEDAGNQESGYGQPYLGVQGNACIGRGFNAGYKGGSNRGTGYGFEGQKNQEKPDVSYKDENEEGDGFEQGRVKATIDKFENLQEVNSGEDLERGNAGSGQYDEDQGSKQWDQQGTGLNGGNYGQGKDQWGKGDKDSGYRQPQNDTQLCGNQQKQSGSRWGKPKFTVESQEEYEGEDDKGYTQASARQCKNPDGIQSLGYRFSELNAH